MRTANSGNKPLKKHKDCDKVGIKIFEKMQKNGANKRKPKAKKPVNKGVLTGMEDYKKEFIEFLRLSASRDMKKPINTGL